ncbi:MAG TPA: gamma-glutamyltransferase family protein [Paenirhodobacter sp.]
MFNRKPDPWFENGHKKALICAEAMIVSPNPQAALAGYDMLRAGGNAVDAAIAAMAVTGVVEASQEGPGGDCFALIHDPKTGRTRAYNGSGRAPRALSADYLLERGFTEVPRVSPHSVSIPGAIEGWCRLQEDYGRLDRAEIFAPAIRYAEEGFVLHPRVVRDWHESRDEIARQPDTARHFLKDGRAPEIGDRWVLPGYGALYRDIARNGAKAFYEGAFAARLVDHLRALGGLHSLEDFATHRGEYVEPVATTAYGQSFVECPPNGQGVAALVLIRLIERLMPGCALNSVAGHHLLSEASKIAFSLRDDLIAEPQAMQVSVDRILSDATIDKIAAGISRDRAMPRTPARNYLPEHSDTSYVSVVDRDGMTVSLISSIFTDFGSTLTEPQSGILLQNRAAGFVLDAGHPNRLEGGKRPLHTIIPGMALRDGRPTLSYGVTGGHYQPVGHALLAQAIFAEGMDPQEALNLARSHCQTGAIHIEEVVPQDLRAGLVAMGHEVTVSTHPIGGGHAIHVDQDRGVLIGGTDSRRDGIVVGY